MSFYFNSPSTHPVIYNPIDTTAYTSTYTKIPLVIDNGSFEYRAGFANEPNPRCRYRSLVGNSRSRKESDIVVIGSPELELDVYKYKVKSQFENGVSCHFDVLENMLDFTFESFGIESDRINHPILMTESICNPNYCRRRASELLFECYRVPSVCYSVDGLLSYHYNASTNNTGNAPHNNALVINCGFEATHIIPIVNGAPLFQHALRLDLGGYHQIEYLMRSLCLKYPLLRGSINWPFAYEMFEKHTFTSIDFLSELKQFGTDNRKSVIIQLPFQDNSLTEEEQAIRTAKRKKAADRLREIASKKRESKIEEYRATLASLGKLKSKFESGKLKKNDYLFQIRDGGFEDEEDFNTTFIEIQRKLDKTLGETPPPKSKEELYPLINIPDSELTEHEIKQKRCQIMRKGAAIDREQEKQQMLLKQQKEESEFKKDPENFLKQIREDKQACMNGRIRRLQLKKDLTDRKSVASKRRKQLINLIAASKPTKRKRSGSGPGNNSEDDDDEFGFNESDWQIYRQIQKPADQAYDSESEEEREEMQEYDRLLAKYDPEGFKAEIVEKRITVEDFQVALTTERIRAPELLFQPAIRGNNQAGLAECIDIVLKRLSLQQRRAVFSKIFVTGGVANSPHIGDRIHNEVRALAPDDLKVDVYTASDPSIDAYRGGCLLARSEPDIFNQYCISKSEYDEKGHDYLTEHFCSNRLARLS